MERKVKPDNLFDANLLSYAFQFLPSRDMAQVLRVNTTWNKAGNKPSSWTSLHIRQAKYCDARTHPFQRYKEVKVLNLWKCLGATSPLLTTLVQHCPKLQVLKLVSWRERFLLSQEFFQAISNGCPDLRQVYLDALVALTQGCRNLQDLTLGRDMITDQCIMEVARVFSNLQALRLDSGRLSKKSIVALARGCPKLKTLDFRGCHTDITDETVEEELTRSCPNLQTLVLADCKNLTKRSFMLLAQRCPNLQDLNLYGFHITDESIVEVAQQCPKLQTLYLEGCKHLTDKSMVALAQGCPNLQRLGMRYCENLTDKSVMALDQGCPNLRYLETRSRKLTEASIEVLVKSCRDLETLIIEICSQAMTDAIDTLVPKYPHLSIVR